MIPSTITKGSRPLIVESPRISCVTPVDEELNAPRDNSEFVSMVVSPVNRPAKVFVKFDSGDLSKSDPKALETAPVTAFRGNDIYPKSIISSIFSASYDN